MPTIPKFHWSRSPKSSTAKTAKMHVTKTSMTSEESTGNNAAEEVSIVTSMERSFEWSCGA